MWRCINIDPANEVSDNGIWYLVADLSLKCSDDQTCDEMFSYAKWCLFYPLGFPLLIYYLLYQRRDWIQDQEFSEKVRLVMDANIELNGKYPLMNTLKNYYEKYKRAFWFWEIIEISQRVLISSAIKSFFPDDEHVVILSLILSIFFLEVILCHSAL